MSFPDRVFSYDIPAFNNCEELKHLASCEFSYNDLVRKVLDAARQAQGDRVLDVLDAVLMCLETSFDAHMRRLSLDMVFNLARNGLSAQLLELRAVTTVVRVGREEMSAHSMVVLCCLNALHALAGSACNAPANYFANQGGIQFAEEAERYHNKSAAFKKLVQSIRRENSKFSAPTSLQALRAERNAEALLREEENDKGRKLKRLGKKKRMAIKKRASAAVIEPALDLSEDEEEPETPDDEVTCSTVACEREYFLDDQQDVVLACVLQVLEDRNLVKDFLGPFLAVA